MNADEGIDGIYAEMLRYVRQRVYLRRRLFAYLRRHGGRGFKRASYISDWELVQMVDKVRVMEAKTKGGEPNE